MNWHNPDITETVDWALKTNYLATYLRTFLPTYLPAVETNKETSKCLKQTVVSTKVEMKVLMAVRLHEKTLYWTVYAFAKFRNSTFSSGIRVLISGCKNLLI